MNTMHPRIIGTEMEYGISGIEGGQHHFDSDEINNTLPLGLYEIGEFLSNGGRLYVDMGHKLEYATPESPGPYQATISEFAGEALVFSSLTQLMKSEIVDEYPVRKRVVDDWGNTWGYHENYLVPRGVYGENRYRALLAGHLATRTVFSGAGKLTFNSQGGARIVPAQKMHDITVTAGANDTAEKALVNTRDEPFTEDTKWARQHVVCGDANLTPLITFMKLGSTSLVLRLAEHERSHMLAHLEIGYPLAAAKTVGMDTSLRKTFELENGNKITALGYQKELVERIRKLSERVQLPSDELLALELWCAALDDLENHPDRAKQYIEWAAKIDLFARQLERRKPEDLQEELKLLDAAWDNINPDISVGKRWMEHQQPADMALHLSDDIISYATIQPPQTRAKLRGEFIRRLAQAHTINTESIEINWGSIKRNGGTLTEMNDPYQTVSGN